MRIARFRAPHGDKRPPLRLAGLGRRSDDREEGGVRRRRRLDDVGHRQPARMVGRRRRHERRREQACVLLLLLLQHLLQVPASDELPPWRICTQPPPQRVRRCVPTLSPLSSPNPAVSAGHREETVPVSMVEEGTLTSPSKACRPRCPALTTNTNHK